MIVLVCMMTMIKKDSDDNVEYFGRNDIEVVNGDLLDWESTERPREVDPTTTEINRSNNLFR